jgi:hypothetical protein
MIAIKRTDVSAPHPLKTSKLANPEAALPLLTAKFKPGFLLRIL